MLPWWQISDRPHPVVVARAVLVLWVELCLVSLHLSVVPPLANHHCQYLGCPGNDCICDGLGRFWERVWPLVRSLISFTASSIIMQSLVKHWGEVRGGNQEAQALSATCRQVRHDIKCCCTYSRDRTHTHGYVSCIISRRSAQRSDAIRVVARTYVRTLRRINCACVRGCGWNCARACPAQPTCSEFYSVGWWVAEVLVC